MFDLGEAMKFLELVKKRQSVRGYLEKSVEREMIERCLEAARMAPSACNSQPWKFIVVDDPELKNKIADKTYGNLISFNRFTAEAPVLVLIVSERQKFLARFGSIVKNRQLKLIDIGIAAEHFCLQAAEEGLGTCMMGWFSEKKISRLMEIPKSKRVELIISLGFANSIKIRPKKRKDIHEIRSYNNYK